MYLSVSYVQQVIIVAHEVYSSQVVSAMQGTTAYKVQYLQSKW